MKRLLEWVEAHPTMIIVGGVVVLMLAAAGNWEIERRTAGAIEALDARHLDVTGANASFQEARRQEKNWLLRRADAAMASEALSKWREAIGKAEEALARWREAAADLAERTGRTGIPNDAVAEYREKFLAMVERGDDFRSFESALVPVARRIHADIEAKGAEIVAARAEAKRRAARWSLAAMIAMSGVGLLILWASRFSGMALLRHKERAEAAQRKAKEEGDKVADNAMDLALAISVHFEVLKRVSLGDISVEAQTDSRDDLLMQLASTTNTMLQSLRDLLREIRSAGLTAGTLSEEVFAAYQEITQGTKSFLAQLNDATAATTELSTSIQEVSGSAVAARDTANKAAAAAQSGGDAVTQNIKAMQKIKSTVGETSEQIIHLGESGKRIGKIVEVITNIADQTSLLALNAAIEAARAGEHGQGFAVVADEVSKLADRSAKSAKEIEELIETIGEQTRHAVSSMNAVAQEVDGGMSLAQTTGERLSDIINGINNAARSIGEISIAVQEQAKASDDISTSMERLSRINKESLAATEQALGNAKEMQAIAKSLRETVERFKVA